MSEDYDNPAVNGNKVDDNAYKVNFTLLRRTINDVYEPVFLFIKEGPRPANF